MKGAVKLDESRTDPSHLLPTPLNSFHLLAPSLSLPPSLNLPPSPTLSQSRARLWTPSPEPREWTPEPLRRTLTSAQPPVRTLTSAPVRRRRRRCLCLNEERHKDQRSTLAELTEVDCKVLWEVSLCSWIVVRRVARCNIVYCKHRYTLNTAKPVILLLSVFWFPVYCVWLNCCGMKTVQLYVRKRSPPNVRRVESTHVILGSLN